MNEENSLLILDDDEPFTRTLGRAMERRGFEVKTLLSVKKGFEYVSTSPPAYAIVDLRLEDGNGLDIVEAIRSKRPESSIVVLTGYGAIATAVAAVKIGAVDYLAKPADANDIVAALLSTKKISHHPQRIQCQQIELNGNIFSVFLNYAIEMFQKLQED